MNIPLFTGDNVSILVLRGNRRVPIGEHLAEDFDRFKKHPERYSIVISNVFKNVNVAIFYKPHKSDNIEGNRPLALKRYRLRDVKEVSEPRDSSRSIRLEGKEALAFITHLQSFLL